MNSEQQPRWRQRLDKELVFRAEFVGLDETGWRRLLRTRRVTSQNHDTVLSLDWPHFCSNATVSCGGIQGWCYTFQGNQASKLHNRHAAMVDVLARTYPALFGEAVDQDVSEAVAKRLIAYPNIRYSGSGEVAEAHLPALEEVRKRGIHLWGFTRNLKIADALRLAGAGVIVSCDRTSLPGFVEQAFSAGFPLAYSSAGVQDRPPEGTVVTFPVHKVGRVREVVDSPTVCPKVLADFLEETRPQGACQRLCSRCHDPKVAC